MCSLYSITRSQNAMRRLFAAARDLTGNLPPLPAVYPDAMAPIVRIADGERQLEMMRGGHARATGQWLPAGDEHPQHEQHALAALAAAGEPLPGAGDVVLRMG